jgi:hypothetical protein
MQFHLNYTPRESNYKLDHSKKIFLSGSCFSENIGEKLQERKFDVLSNPAGILFNPASIANYLQGVIANEFNEEKFLLERDGLYYHWMYHSSIHGNDKNEITEKIIFLKKQAHEFLKEADLLIITFGSAFVYRHLQLNRTVANCHKQPQHHFEKRMLGVEQIVRNYSVLVQHLQLFNPNLRILFTVSPVKYLKDGIEENSRSKATLLLSAHELVTKFSNCFYFPSYEIINDDLRDYRFYKEDLAHPNEQAVEYVWQKFSECFFGKRTFDLNEKISRLHRVLSHRIMNTESTENKKLDEFVQNLREELLHHEPILKGRI